MLLKQSTARNKVILLIGSADHVTGLAGATLTITSSKDGGAFGSITPTVTDLGNGLYNLALTTGHTDTLGDLALHITAANADPRDISYQVVADLPGASVASVTAAVTVGAINGTASNLKKNQALANFEFVMTDSSAHAPKTGLTVTGTASLDGAAFASLTNAISEVASGVYKVSLAAADVNANTVTLRFTAVDADDTLVTLITQP